MTIIIPSPEKRIADLEELVHVLTEDASIERVKLADGNVIYVLGWLGEGCHLTARQAESVWAVQGVSGPEGLFEDVLVEYLTEPLEDRDAPEEI